MNLIRRVLGTSADETEVSQLRSQVSTLTDQISAMGTRISSLESQLASARETTGSEQTDTEWGTRMSSLESQLTKISEDLTIERTNRRALNRNVVSLEALLEAVVEVIRGDQTRSSSMRTGGSRTSGKVSLDEPGSGQDSRSDTSASMRRPKPRTPESHSKTGMATASSKRGTADSSRESAENRTTGGARNKTHQARDETPYTPGYTFTGTDVHNVNFGNTVRARDGSVWVDGEKLLDDSGSD